MDRINNWNQKTGKHNTNKLSELKSLSQLKVNKLHLRVQGRSTQSWADAFKHRRFGFVSPDVTFHLEECTRCPFPEEQQQQTCRATRYGIMTQICNRVNKTNSRESHGYIVSNVCKLAAAFLGYLAPLWLSHAAFTLQPQPLVHTHTHTHRHTHTHTTTK